MLALVTDMSDVLTSRAIDPATAFQSGFVKTVNGPSELPGFRPGQYDGPGLLLAWRGIDGSLSGLQYRPDSPSKIRKDGSPKKYVFPSGQSVSFGWVVPPASDSQPVLVVEGLLKAIAVAQTLNGSHAVVAVPSCSVSKDPAKTDFSWALGRDIVVALDADLATNRDVWFGGEFLRDGFKNAGGILGGAQSVKFLRVPGEGKDGVDDALARIPEEKRRLALATWIQTAGTLPTQPAPKGARMLPAPEYPSEVAIELLGDYTDEDGNRTLVNRDKVFHAWTGDHWAELSPEQVYDRTHLTLKLAYFKRRDKEGNEKVLPWNPKISAVREVVQALASETNVSEVLGGDVVDNVWLAPDTDAAEPHPLYGRHVIAFRNGLVDPNSADRSVHPHSSRWFSQTCVPYDYDPAAREPVEWLKFLGSVWPEAGVSDCADLLQEFMGYTLSGRTDLHKFLNPYGPKRSGKGTIVRVMVALIGAANHYGMSLGDLGTNFGKAGLIGRGLASDGDVRMQTMQNKSEVLSSLLKITGGDNISIDRKYRKAWNGTLPARLVLASNDPLNFPDESGALAARQLILPTAISFFGREDWGLTDRLLGELDSIAKWAFDGLDRLNRNGGRFTHPQSVRQVEETQHRANAPLSAFLDDWCATGERGDQVPKADLYDCYKQWCTANGQDNVMTQVQFATRLYATHRGVEESRVRMGGKLTRVFTGVRITAVLVVGTGYTDPDDLTETSETETSETSETEPVAAPVETERQAPVPEVRAETPEPVAAPVETETGSETDMWGRVFFGLKE